MTGGKISLGFRSIADCVVDYLKNYMESGKLWPGDRIDEKELCRVLGVSRTPIREALIRLEKEGFVELLPRRSIRVKKLSPKEIREFYQIIRILEAETAEIAVDKINEQHILGMEELYNRMSEAVRNSNPGKYIDSNLALHNIHIALAENKTLSDIVSNLKIRLYDFPRKIIGLPEWSEAMMSDHSKLIQFFKERDKSNVKRVINEHWDFDRSYPYIIKYYGLEKESE